MIPLVGKGEKEGQIWAGRNTKLGSVEVLVCTAQGGGGCRGESLGKGSSLDADMGTISLWMAAKFRKDRAPIP